MTDLRKQLAAIIYDPTNGTAATDKALATAQDLIEALPDMVQPLVWDVDLRGRSISGEYTIWQFQAGFFVEHRAENNAIAAKQEALEDAKAAAQAHQVATILSAFGVQGWEA